MSEQQKYPWLGDKTEKIQIRVTPAEKKIIQEHCKSRGGITVGQYLLDLHRRNTGQIT